MVFDDYLLYGTLNVTSVNNSENTYVIGVKDSQRFAKRGIVRDMAETDCVDSLGTSSTGGVIEVVDASLFDTVWHGEGWYNGDDNEYQGYVEIAGTDINGRDIKETARWKPVDDTHIDIVERGCFGTRIVDLQGSTDGGTTSVRETTYLDLPLPAMIIALMTGDYYGEVGKTLPEKYHAGVDPSLLDIASFEDLDTDLWNFRLQFRGIEDEEAKDFIYNQCLAPFNLEMLIDQYGRFRIKRFTAVPSTSTGVKTLTYDELISVSGLERDANAVRNIFAINWSWDQTEGYYPLRNTYADGGSRALNNFWSDVHEINLRGIYNTSESNQFIVSQLAEGIRARFSAPRVLPKVTGFMSDLFDLEIGDIVRLDLYNHPDYASTTGLTYASFEIQGMSYDFFAGTVGLELFGTSGTAEQLDLQGGENTTVMVNDGSWTDLGSYGTVDGDTLTINANATLTEGKYLWDGNVILNATLTIERSVFLRYQNWTMLSGARIDGAAQGVAGTQGIFGGADLRNEGIRVDAGTFSQKFKRLKSTDTGYVGTVAAKNVEGLPSSKLFTLGSDGQIIGFNYTQRLYGNGGLKAGAVNYTGQSSGVLVSNDTNKKGGAGLVMIGNNFFYTDADCIDVSGEDGTFDFQNIELPSGSDEHYYNGETGIGWPGTVQFIGVDRTATPPDLRGAVRAFSGQFGTWTGIERRPRKDYSWYRGVSNGDYTGRLSDLADTSLAAQDYGDQVVRVYRAQVLEANTGTSGKDKVPNALAPTLNITEQVNFPRQSVDNLSTLQINVTPQPGDDNFSYARFDYRVLGTEAWTPIDYDVSTSATKTVIANGRTFEFQATAYNKNSQVGGITITEYTVANINPDSENSDGGSDAPPIDVTVPDIKRLELVNRLDDDENWNKWKSPNAEFRWAKLSVTNGGSIVQVNGSVDLHLEGYKVRIKRTTGEILREEIAKDSIYTYTFDKNKKDTNGSPVREFIIEVQAVTTTGYVSEFASIEVGNPAPAAPANVVSLAGFTSILFTYGLPVDTDFVGIDFYILEGTSGDVYADGAVTRVSGNTFNPDGLKLGTTYQVGAVSVDQFGTGGQIAQFGIITSNIDSSVLGDITTPLTLDENGGRIITNNSGYYGIMGVTTLPDVTNPVIFAAHDALAGNTVFYIDVNGNAYFSGELGAATGVFGDVSSGEYIQYANGLLTFGPNATIGSNADRTITVGASGDYTTLDEALVDLSKTVPAFKDGGFTATIMILNGTVVPSFTINGLNLGWITIESEGDPIEFGGEITITNGAFAPIFNLDMTEVSFQVELGSTLILGANINLTGLTTATTGQNVINAKTGASVILEGKLTVYTLTAQTCISINDGAKLQTDYNIDFYNNSGSINGTALFVGAGANVTVDDLDIKNTFTINVSVYAGFLHCSTLISVGGTTILEIQQGGNFVSTFQVDIGNYTSRGIRLRTGARASIAKVFGGSASDTSNVEMYGGIAYIGDSTAYGSNITKDTIDPTGKGMIVTGF